MPESERVEQSHALADSRPGLRLVWWQPDKGFFTAMSSIEQHAGSTWCCCSSSSMKCRPPDCGWSRSRSCAAAGAGAGDKALSEHLRRAGFQLLLGPGTSGVDVTFLFSVFDTGASRPSSMRGAPTPHPPSPLRAH